MLVYDDLFSWEGFGGKLRLASGQCRLRIFNLAKDNENELAYIRPIVVIVSDIPDSGMSIRSCSSHIATMVAKEFNINPGRMLYIEYYSSTIYGEKKESIIPERYEAVDFTWHQDKAIEPRYRKLQSPMLETLKDLVETSQ